MLFRALVARQFVSWTHYYHLRAEARQRKRLSIDEPIPQTIDCRRYVFMKVDISIFAILS